MANISKSSSMPWNVKGKSMPWNPRDESGRPFANAKRYNAGFYQSVQWKKLRQFYIQRHPICELCERQGKVVKGYFVDHIKSIQQGGEPLNADNLQTLCKSCHASKTNKEIGQNKKQKS